MHNLSQDQEWPKSVLESLTSHIQVGIFTACCNLLGDKNRHTIGMSVFCIHAYLSDVSEKFLKFFLLCFIAWVTCLTGLARSYDDDHEYRHSEQNSGTWFSSFGSPHPPQRRLPLWSPVYSFPTLSVILLCFIYVSIFPPFSKDRRLTRKLVVRREIRVANSDFLSRDSNVRSVI
jgi:hypothetical protein